ncbi:MAG: DUF3822 family protein [Thermoflavifilum sp.]|nr:DUF3822 family protein [Thermoflavifilum sp.]
MQITPALEPIYAVDDPVILQTDLSTCTLLLEIGQQKISFAIKNAEERIIQLKAYQLPTHAQVETTSVSDCLEFFLEHEAMLRKPYQDVFIGYTPFPHTLVPIDAFISGAEREYFEPLYLLQEEDHVLIDTIQECKAYNLFAVPASLLALIRKEFSHYSLFHTASALLKAIFKQYADKRGEQLFIYIDQHDAYFIARRHEQLLYVHQIKFSSETDVLYHILAIAKHFQIDISSMRCVLGGEITRQSKLYELLYAYIPIIQWLSRPRPFDYVEAFTRYPGHFFYSNLALALCE